MNITEKEAKAVMNLVGQMNTYEMMAILCKTMPDEKEMEEQMRIVHFMYNRLERELNTDAK